MSELPAIAAEPRQRAGKGAARAVRREGFVPAVIYGGNKEPVSIKVERRLLFSELRKSGFFATQFQITIDGEDHRVLPRDVQFHPVTDVPTHADFLRVTDRTQIRVSVPLSFINEEECEGLAQGGVINMVRHDIEVVCAVGNIPESIVIDLAGKDIGDSIHVSEVELGAGVKPTITDRDFTIVTIAAPTIYVEPVDEEEEEGLEGEELEGEEGEEGEGEAGEAGAEEKKETEGGGE